MHRLATITPVLNDARDLAVAIQSVQAQNEVIVEQIVVAVGPSDDESLEVVEELAKADPRIKVVLNPSGRTPDALNLAIAATDCDVVARVDARSVLPPNYLRDALETMRSTEAGNVGAVQVPVGETLFERAAAAAMKSRAGSGGAAYRSGGTARVVDTAWLGVFRRDALAAVGGYDAAFTRNQDAELNVRLNDAGHAVWIDPRLAVEYRPRSSWSALARQYYEYGWWRFRTVTKHPESLKLRQLAAPVIVLGLVGTVVLAGFVDRRFLLGPVVYVIALLVAGSVSDAQGVREKLGTASALAAMHLGWGAGFLSSAVVALRRSDQV